MKKIILGFAIFMLVAPAKSQELKENEPIKIAVVDFGYVLQKAHATKSLNQQIDAKKEEFKKQAKIAQDQIVAKQKSLASKKSILSSVEFEKERKKYENLIKTEEAKLRKNRKILQSGIKAGMGKLNTIIKKYITTIAKEKGLHLVLPQEQVIISSTDLSITQEVLDLVNSDLKKITINFED